VRYPDGDARLSQTGSRNLAATFYVPQTGRGENDIGCRLCEDICHAKCHQGRDAQGGEAELRQDLSRARTRASLRAAYRFCPTDAIIMMKSLTCGRPTGASCDRQGPPPRAGRQSIVLGPPAIAFATCQTPQRPRQAKARRAPAAEAQRRNSPNRFESVSQRRVADAQPTTDSRSAGGLRSARRQIQK